MPKASEVDRYRVDLQLTRPYHQWSDPEKALSFFTELLHAADGMSDDSKLVTLSSIVEHELGFGRNVCVFTSFDETATFLKLAASDRMWFNAASIKMSDPDDERSYTLSRFRDRGGLLVAASGTTVGYDLGEVNIVVSYDIPLSKREVNYRTLSLRTSNGVGTRWLALSSDYTN
jgi:superfamily II DNA/RNA helicase